MLRLRCYQISRQSAYEGPTHRPPLSPENIPGTHFCWRLSRTQSHNAVGRNISMKNDTIENRTRDLPAFSAVPQTNASPRILPPVVNCSSSNRNSVVFCVVAVNVLTLIIRHDWFSVLNLMAQSK
jgi:hypothetical protein